MEGTRSRLLEVLERTRVSYLLYLRDRGRDIWNLRSIYGYDRDDDGKVLLDTFVLKEEKLPRVMMREGCTRDAPPLASRSDIPAQPSSSIPQTTTRDAEVIAEPHTSGPSTAPPESYTLKSLNQEAAAL